MRHRIVSGTGLGNPEKALLDNQGEVNREFADAAIVAYFSWWGGFDYQVGPDYVAVGIEPSYQYEKLKILHINKDKNKSFIQMGKAWGGYGSQVVKTTKFYSDYKYRGKFVKFVDQWHAVLFGEKSRKIKD